MTESYSGSHGAKVGFYWGANSTVFRAIKHQTLKQYLERITCTGLFRLGNNPRSSKRVFPLSMSIRHRSSHYVRRIAHAPWGVPPATSTRTILFRQQSWPARRRAALHFGIQPRVSQLMLTILAFLWLLLLSALRCVSLDSAVLISPTNAVHAPPYRLFRPPGKCIPSANGKACCQSVSFPSPACRAPGIASALLSAVVFFC